MWNPSYATQPLQIKAKPDIAAFFGQALLPYLWPKDELYVSHVDSQDNPQQFLKGQWATVYLHHPESEVLAELLQILPELIPEAPVEVIIEHASLLAHSDSTVREAAAKTIGKYDEVVTKLREYGFRKVEAGSEDAGKLALPSIDALARIGDKNALEALAAILSMHLTKRKAEPISDLKESLDHLRGISDVRKSTSGIMGILAEFSKVVLGLGWGQGGVGEEIEPWEEEVVFLKFLEVDTVVIKGELGRLVSLLCRYGGDMENNPIAQLLNKLGPAEFMPLIREYLDVLEGVVEYIEKHELGILSGLDDDLRDAESGQDLKYVEDCKAQIESRSQWRNCISLLKGWLGYWGP